MKKYYVKAILINKCIVNLPKKVCLLFDTKEEAQDACSHFSSFYDPFGSPAYSITGPKLVNVEEVPVC